MVSSIRVISLITGALKGRRRARKWVREMWHEKDSTCYCWLGGWRQEVRREGSSPRGRTQPPGNSQQEQRLQSCSCKAMNFANNQNKQRTDSPLAPPERNILLTPCFSPVRPIADFNCTELEGNKSLGF